MNTKSFFPAIFYTAIILFLLGFLTLAIVAIAVSPVSAQAVPIKDETVEPHILSDPALSASASTLPTSPNSAASTANDRTSPASSQVIFKSVLVLPRDLEAPVRTAPIHTAPFHTAIVLNFKSRVSETFWQTLLSELGRPEISSSLEGPVLWTRNDRFPAASEFPDIIQVRLQGDCSSPNQNPTPPRFGPLGWTFLVSGKIQPFAVVDCDRVRHTLASTLRDEPPQTQQEALARAISRIIFHELTHIVTQSAAHSSAGLQKAYLTPADLTQLRRP